MLYFDAPSLRCVVQKDARLCDSVMTSKRTIHGVDSHVPRPYVVANNALPSLLRKTSFTLTLGKSVPACDHRPPRYTRTPLSVPASSPARVRRSAFTEVLESGRPMSVHVVPLVFDTWTSPATRLVAYACGAYTPRATNTCSLAVVGEPAGSIAMSFTDSGKVLRRRVQVAPRVVLRQRYPNPVPA